MQLAAAHPHVREPIEFSSQFLGGHRVEIGGQEMLVERTYLGDDLFAPAACSRVDGVERDWPGRARRHRRLVHVHVVVLLAEAEHAEAANKRLHVQVEA